MILNCILYTTTGDRTQDFWLWFWNYFIFIRQEKGKSSLKIANVFAQSVQMFNVVAVICYMSILWFSTRFKYLQITRKYI